MARQSKPLAQILLRENLAIATNVLVVHESFIFRHMVNANEVARKCGSLDCAIRASAL
jgi:hypothetical protein